MKVLVINQCATNKGDRAVLYFLVRELKRNDINDITVSATNPYFWITKNELPVKTTKFIHFGWNPCPKAGRPKTNFLSKIITKLKDCVYSRIFFPLVRGALLRGDCPWYIRILSSREYWDAVKATDIVIGTGGHRVTTLLAKDAVFPATFDMAVALLQKKPLILWSQTIGPFRFTNEKNRMLIKKILSEASLIYIRDASSEEEVVSMGISKNHVRQTRESVFGLSDIIKVRNKPSMRCKVLGVSVYMAQKRSPKQHEDYVSAMSQLVDHSAENGYRVQFFPMEMENADLPCIKSIIDKCRHKEACSIIEGYPDTEKHMRMVSECRIFVGHKTHSVIFSLTVGTPVIAIAYHSKTGDFMNQVGLSKYCVSDNNLSGRGLIEVFDRMQTRLDEISDIELAYSKREGTRIRNDFSRLIADFRKSLNDKSG